MSTLNAANDVTANLAKMIYGGQQAMAEQAMKQVQAQAQMQVLAQQQQVALEAVAMMTGIGTKVDTVA